MKKKTLAILMTVCALGLSAVSCTGKDGQSGAGSETAEVSESAQADGQSGADGEDGAKTSGSAEESNADGASGNAEERDADGVSGSAEESNADGASGNAEESDADKASGSAEGPGDAADAPWIMYSDSVFKQELGDLDGNGVQEFGVYVSGEMDVPDDMAYCSFYWNGEQIYSYPDKELPIEPGSAVLLDLDGDGEKEIFLTMDPHVNSMPLMEYTVLKQTDQGWKELEVYHAKEDLHSNSFPIRVVYKPSIDSIVLSCDGLDKEIAYNYREHYEKLKENAMEGMAEAFDSVLDGTAYEEGAASGNLAPWGIWEIEPRRFEQTDCLVATQGLYGVEDRYDELGTVEVCFCYDNNGKIKVLDIQYKE